MPVVDRSHRAVDVVKDAVLHDARATELRQPGCDRAAQIMIRHTVRRRVPRLTSYKR